jgi:hypothetical protein
VKSVKNFRYVEKTSAECNEDSYLAILHLPRVELHCKLQEKLHRVTWPLVKLVLPDQKGVAEVVPDGRIGGKKNFPT